MKILFETFSPSSRSVMFALFLIISIGFFLRVDGLVNSGSYWFDEIISIELVKKPILDSWQFTRLENNPPLYFWLLKVWSLIFGFSEIATRSLSLVIGVATIPLAYFLGKELLGKLEGLIFSLIVSLSSFLIYFHLEARMYALLFFLICLSLFFYWKIISKSYIKSAYWVGYFLATLFLMYTHVSGAILILAQLIYALMLYKKNLFLYLKKIIISIISIGVLMTPFIYSIVDVKLDLLKEGSLWDGWYFNLPIQTIPAFITLPISFLAPFFTTRVPIELPLIPSLLFLLPAIIIFIFFNKSWKNFLIKPVNVYIFLSLLFLVPFLIISFFSSFNVNKYLMPAALAFYLLLSVGITEAIKMRQGVIRTLFISGSFLLVVLLALYSFTRHSIFTDPYNELYSFFSENKVDLIITDPVIGSMIATHYLKHPSPPVFIVYDNKRGSEGYDLLEYSLRYNWVYTNSWKHTKVDRIYLANQVNEIISKDIKNIGYIFLQSPQERIVKSALRNLGFTTETWRFWGGRDSVRISVLNHENK